MNSDLARANTENLKSESPALLDIELFELPPASYLELPSGFPEIIPLNPPSVTVKDSELEPFNHPILLYRFTIKLKETKERENRERGKRGREMVWRQREEEK